MPDPTTPAESSADPEQSRGDHRGTRPVSDDLVRQVADRVYAMLTQDLAIERERQRPRHFDAAASVFRRGDRSV